MTTKTSTVITNELRLTMLKHLANGKDLDQVATIVRKPRALVLDVVSKHGYPNSLAKGIAVLEAKIEKDRTTLPPATPEYRLMSAADGGVVPRAPRPATTSPSSVTHPDARTVGQPDEIRVLLNTAKGHPSKKIQNAANRVFDSLDRLRILIREDEAKHAERRKVEAEKAAAKAEVERLERQLAAAKAKLRGKSAGATAAQQPQGDHACDRDGCGRAFGTVQALRLHQRRAHEGFDPNAVKRAAS